MLSRIVIASKTTTLLSPPANSSESVITLAGDRSLIKWNTEDLFLIAINTPYLLSNDRGTTENLYSPKYYGKSISWRVLEATRKRLISLRSSLMFTTPSFVLILHDFTCILNVGIFLFFSGSQTETSPKNVSSTKLFYNASRIASQSKKTFAKFGSNTFLVITLNTESVLLKLILRSENTASNFPTLSVIRILEVPVTL